MVDGSNAAQVQDMLSRPIDWNSVEPRLSALQNAGRAYLEAQLAFAK
jgi:hypothetical protein